MVYKRYITRNGKRLGPYYYESYRDEKGRVKSNYLGTKPPKEEPKQHQYAFIILVTLLLLFTLSSYELRMTGLAVSNSTMIITNGTDSTEFYTDIESNDSITNQTITVEFSYTTNQTNETQVFNSSVGSQTQTQEFTDEFLIQEESPESGIQGFQSCNFPYFGTWNINNATKCENEIIILNGTITVNSTEANLTLVNTTLRFNSSLNGEYGINVSIGSRGMFIYNSIIESNNDNNFTFVVYAPFEMIDSELHDCGYRAVEEDYGLSIYHNNVLIKNNLIKQNYFGVYIKGGDNILIQNNNITLNEEANLYLRNLVNASLINNSISNIQEGFGYGIYFYNVNYTTLTNNLISNHTRNIYTTGNTKYITLINNTLLYPLLDDLRLSSNSVVISINSSFNRSKVYVSPTSNLTVQWYLRVNVTDEDGDPVEAANVSVYRNKTLILPLWEYEEEWTQNTSSNGLTNYNIYNIVTEGIARGGFVGEFAGGNTSYTTHLISVSKTGYENNESYYLVNKSGTTNIILEELPEGITSCGFIYNSTILISDIDTSSECFQIESDNVVFDCDNHSITSTEGQIAFNISNHDNITIKNCVIFGFYRAFYVSNSTNASILNNYLEGQTNNTIYAISGSTNLLVKDNTINNTANGISIDANSHYVDISHNNIIDCNASGIEVYSQQNNIKYNRLINNTNESIRLFGSNMNLKNNFIQSYDNYYDFYSYSGSYNVTLLNNTFDKSNYDVQSEADITIQWYLTINVTNTTNQTIENATINIYNKDYELETSTVTDQYGQAEVVLEELNQTGTTKYYSTPHMLIVEKEGYQQGDYTVNLTETNSTQINMQLSGGMASGSDAGLTINLTDVNDTISLNKYSNFTINAEIRCDGMAGSCGFVTARARFNGSTVEPDSLIVVPPQEEVSTPFYSKQVIKIPWEGYDPLGKYPYGIVVDSEGNSFVTGEGMNGQLYLIKISPDGLILWDITKENTRYGSNLVLDKNEDVYVTGAYNDGNDYYMIIKYNNSNAEELGLYVDENTKHSAPEDITLDENGDLYLTGYDNTGGNYYTVKYNGSGDDKYWNATQSEWNTTLSRPTGFGRAIKTDFAGNLFVTGNDHYEVIKYNSSTGQETGYTNNSNGYRTYDMTLDTEHNVILTGNTPTWSYFLTTKYNNSLTHKYWEMQEGASNSLAVTSDYNNDVYNIGSKHCWVSKYNSTNGHLLWDEYYKLNGCDLTKMDMDITVDYEGNVYAAFPTDLTNPTTFYVRKFTQVLNPKSCGYMDVGDSCNVSWIVTVTGDTGSEYWADINVTSDNSSIQGNDTENVKIIIGNAPPFVRRMSFSPEIPQDDDNMYITVNCTDDNTGDTIQAYWNVNQDGTQRDDLSGSQTVTLGMSTLLQVIGAGNTSVGEYWNVTVYCNDGNASSSNHTITRKINSLPNPPIVTITPENLTTIRDLTGLWQFSDNDSDTENGTEWKWYINNQSSYLEDPLVLYYDFEDLTDKSNNNNNGNLYGNAHPVPEGVVGKAYNFTTTPGWGEMIQVNDSPSLRINDTVSFFVWYKRRSLTGQDSPHLVVKSGNCLHTASDECGFKMYIEDGSPAQMTVSISNGTGGIPELTTQNLTWGTNRWYYLGFTFNGTHAKFYRDGELINIRENKNQTSGATRGLKETNTSLRIGSKTYDDNDYLDGYLDELKLFNKELTQEEVWNEYNLMHYGKMQKSPLFLCHFDNTTICKDGEEPQWSNYSFTEGKYETKGVFVNDSDLLNYSSQGNFNKDEGTIEFWVKINWSIDDHTQHRFFEIQHDTQYYGYSIFKRNDSPVITFRYFNGTYDLSNGNDIDLNSSPLEWEQGEWHHIAATWNEDKGTALYIDGGLNASSCQFLGTPGINPRMYIGSSYYPGAPFAGARANSTIEEFIIYGEVLNTEEIKASYSRNYPKYGLDSDVMEQEDEMILSVKVSDGKNYTGWVNSTRLISKSYSLNITINMDCNQTGNWTVNTTLECNSSTIDVNSLTIEPTGKLILDNITLLVGETTVHPGGYFEARNGQGTIVQNDNLWINGTFILNRETLRMNGTSDGLMIYVGQNGSLIVLNNSNITNGYGLANNSANYIIRVRGDKGARNFTMKNSYLLNAGYATEKNSGLYLYGSNNTEINIVNNTLLNNYQAMYIHSCHGSTITDNYIGMQRSSNPGIEFNGDSSDSYAIRNTLNGTSISLSSNTTNIIIKSNLIVDNNGSGITLLSTSGHEIINNTIINATGGAGIHLSGNNNNVSNNIIKNSHNDAISLISSVNNIIHNNYINNTYGIGINITTSSDNIIKGNYISNINQDGIRLIQSGYNNLTANIVNKSTNTGWYRAGIYLEGESDDNIIRDSKIQEIGYNGIRLNNSYNNQIINNSIVNISYDCINIRNSQHTLIKDNYISKCSYEKWIYTGIMLYWASNNNISSCHIQGILGNSNNSAGIFIMNSSNIISTNTIINSTNGSDVFLYHNSSLHLINNTFNKSKIITNREDSNLKVSWYLDIYVNDSNGWLEGVNISGYEIAGVLGFNNQTDSTGMKQFQITEFVKNLSSGYNHNNYTIEFEKENYLSQTRKINLTESTTIYETLNEEDDDNDENNGGGSITPSEPICNQSLWTCEAWGNCEGGIQEQNCTNDCETTNTTTRICTIPVIIDSCENGIKDGNESAIDCGGSCVGCEDGKTCNYNDDCLSGYCALDSAISVCYTPDEENTKTNETQEQEETGTEEPLLNQLVTPESKDYMIWWMNITNSTINKTVYYDNLTNKTTINIIFTAKENLTNVNITEEIDKCVLYLLKLDENGSINLPIEFKNMNFTIINKDPLIVWYFPEVLEGETIDLSYIVEGELKEYCLKLVKEKYPLIQIEIPKPPILEEPKNVKMWELWPLLITLALVILYINFDKYKKYIGIKETPNLNKPITPESNEHIKKRLGKIKNRKIEDYYDELEEQRKKLMGTHQDKRIKK